MFTKFDIFAKLNEEIDDFDNGGYYIAGQPKSEVQYKNSRKGEKGGYYYSQKDTLEAIDLASASKFKTGIKDEEGQRKTYLNIVNFYRDVMKMKININVSNYIFEPRSLDFTWPVYLMGRQFNIWCDEHSYDDQIDEYGHDLSTYGSTLAKKLRDCTERVPLRTVRITPSAKTAYHAASSGGYVLLENSYHYNEIKQYPGWKKDGLSKTKSYNCFERYALVPESMLKDQAWKTNNGIVENMSDDEEMVLAQAILLPEEKEKNKYSKGKILWMEKLDEQSFPLEECHAEKVDGRWLGRGEIEKQLENQIARNLTANLRRRGLLWSVKKIYQSTDEEVQSNLVMEVRDGQVLKVKPNGQISQVNTGSQNLGEFASDEQNWKENSQQVAFAFNVATGENMPANTPFSLGVLLDRAVTSHFTMIRKTYSNFLKRSFFDQLIPIFKEEYDEEHTQQIPLGSTEIESLKESMITFHTNLRIFEAVISGSKVSEDRIRQDILSEMARTPYLFIDIPQGFYKNANAFMKLNIDDDIGPDITSLTTLYQALLAKQDPRADQVLKMIFAKQGKALDALAGTRPAPAPVQQIPGQTPIKPMIPTPSAPVPTAN